jgi:hypothetical protein
LLAHDRVALEADCPDPRIVNQVAPLAGPVSRLAVTVSQLPSVQAKQAED